MAGDFAARLGISAHDLLGQVRVVTLESRNRALGCF